MSLPDDLMARLVSTYRAAADPSEAERMARYMRDQFPFLGIRAPEQVGFGQQVTRDLAPPTDGELIEIARRCWDLDEREYQYFACRYLSRHVDGRPPQLLATVEVLIMTKPWWDTVDHLAPHVVGPLVAAHPGLRSTLDRWIEGNDHWLARAAIIHQLRRRADTDEDLLFQYALARAGDDEFFIRKAIGWALREYSKTSPESVRDFVDHFGAEFSPLSVREATRRLDG